MNHTQIRQARADELAVLVGIDDDACTLYAEQGIELVLPDQHPFMVAERALWQSALEHGIVYLALDEVGAPVGFAAVTLLDGAAYLDQLSVRRQAMRRGHGRRLLDAAIAWARCQRQPALTLTTYDHLPFNRPFYERCGFRLLPGQELTAGLQHHLDEQRRYLPLPERRVAMRLAL